MDLHPCHHVLHIFGRYLHIAGDVSIFETATKKTKKEGASGLCLGGAVRKNVGRQPAKLFPTTRKVS